MICFSGAEGSSGVAAAAVGAAAILAAAPLFSPLVQIWLLARKSKEEIEDTVRIKAPLQVNFYIKLISQHSRAILLHVRAPRCFSELCGAVIRSFRSVFVTFGTELPLSLVVVVWQWVYHHPAISGWEHDKDFNYNPWLKPSACIMTLSCQ